MSHALDAARSKLRPFGRIQWCACLSGAEALALKKDGYQTCSTSKTMESFLMEEMSIGKNGCTWLYYAKTGLHKPIHQRVPGHNKPRGKGGSVEPL